MHFANLKLAHLVSIIEIPEDESLAVNLTDTEEEDIIQFSNLFVFSSLDHNELHYRKSITDITNSLQVEMTEVDTVTIHPCSFLFGLIVSFLMITPPFHIISPLTHLSL